MQVDFHDQLVALLPRLRNQARALTRDRQAADDLLHDAVCNALAARDSFTPGSNMAAWMHRILRNRFVSDLRARRETTQIEDVPPDSFAFEAPHHERLALRELTRALSRLPAEQRVALMMVAVDGASYEELAHATGTALGTAKSRVFRARRQLQVWLLEPPEPAKARLLHAVAGSDHGERLI